MEDQQKNILSSTDQLKTAGSTQLVNLSSLTPAAGDIEFEQFFRSIYEWPPGSPLSPLDPENRKLQEFRASNNLGPKEARAETIYHASKQPSFHEQNKSFFEKYCICCIGDDDSCDLTRMEITRFNEFKDTMVVPYDELNPQHEESLRQIFTMAFPQNEMPIDNDMKSELWQQIGFQGKNPRTDFRGGGHLSLLVLIYAYKTQASAFEKFSARAEGEEDWFTAISCINVSSIVASYLHMNKSQNMAPKTHERLKSGRQAFKTFARLNREDKKAFFEICSQGLVYLFWKWVKSVKLQKQNGERLPPNFQTQVDATLDCVDRVLRGASFQSQGVKPRNIAQMQKHFEKEIKLLI